MHILLVALKRMLDSTVINQSIVIHWCLDNPKALWLPTIVYVSNTIYCVIANFVEGLLGLTIEQAFWALSGGSSDGAIFSIFGT